MQTTAVHPTVVAESPRELESARPPVIGEDWLAVLVGGALIALVLAGARPSDPRLMAVQVLVPLTIGAWLLRAPLVRFLPGVLVIALLGWLAQEIAALPIVSAWSLEYVVFALAIGLVVAQTISVPPWLVEAVRTEYYIKTGLVVLGAGILFDDIARAGLLGIAQALVVVMSVWA